MLRKKFPNFTYILFFALFILTPVATAAGNINRIQEINRLMTGLVNRAQACGQDLNCRGTIQQQMEALSREYSGLTMDLCTSSADPCCVVEQQKQYIRDAYHVEPVWIQCVPVTFDLVWDIYENSDCTTVKYMLHQGYPGYMGLSYDQKDRTRLLDLIIKGQPFPGHVHSRIESITGVFSPRGIIETTELKTYSSNNPMDYSTDTRASIDFSWSSQFGAKAEGGMYGPLPADRICGSRGCRHEDNHVRFNTMGTDTFSLAEIQSGIKSGKCSREFKISFMPPAMPATHTRKGKLTVTVNFKPTGGMEVFPGEGFKSSGPDINENFVPSDKTYTLKNSSGQPIIYQVNKTADWMDVSPATGSIPAEGTVSVKVSINHSKAKALKSAIHKDNLVFTNTTDGRGNTTRPVLLDVAEEQTWQIKVAGWFKNVMEWDGLVLKDNVNMTTTKIIKAVRFNWNLTGVFVIGKDRGKWVYKNGQVTAAQLTPVTDFQPVHIYYCHIGECLGKMRVNSYVGAPLTGTIMPDKQVNLRWWPFNPAACVNCKPMHPDLPKNWYTAQFLSGEFITQISMGSYPLLNKTFGPVQKQDRLYYKITLKRLK